MTEYEQFEWIGPGTKRVIKGWGWEDWVVNKREYCGKVLHFHKDHRCSFHFHHDKDETFSPFRGKVLIKYGDSDDITTAKEVILNPGDTFYVPPGLRHQIYALEETDLIEFSTFHKDTDSIRIIVGD